MSCGIGTLRTKCKALSSAAKSISLLWIRISYFSQDAFPPPCGDFLPGTNKVLVEIDSYFFRPTEVNELLGDFSKINDDLNWKPKVSLEEGVGILLDNIDYWREAPLWTPKTIADATKNWFKYLG